jgi:hypothetical protein
LQGLTINKSIFRFLTQASLQKFYGYLSGLVRPNCAQRFAAKRLLRTKKAKIIGLAKNLQVQNRFSNNDRNRNSA